MVAKIISGNQISKIVYSEVKEEMDNAGIYPGLAVILVGSNPASISYVKRKEIACNEVGIHTETFSFEENITSHLRSFENLGDEEFQLTRKNNEQVTIKIISGIFSSASEKQIR